MSEKSPDDLKIIDNQLAVGAPAAWNAREAIKSVPNVIITDFFGYGASQLGFLASRNITGTVIANGSAPSDHGYHVAGILNGDYGGGSSPAALVTGTMPEPINLHIIDLANQISLQDADARFVMSALAMSGTVVYSTSLRYNCYSTTTTGACREPSVAMKAAIVWIDIIRSARLEYRVFHATAAGNRLPPRYEAGDAETVITYTSAALMQNIKRADGTAVSPLSNTMVVENLRASGSPRKIECLDENSFIGGTVSAIGTDVTSLSSNGTYVDSGTSMATPQVAGLAAYMLAIDPDMTPQKVKDIILRTSQSVPDFSGIFGPSVCSTWGAPAPAIDAYAAVLALDKSSALNGTRSDAPVRNAILDIAGNDPTVPGKNGQFDENDLEYYITQIEAGSNDIRKGTPKVKYSRADLNGDGYDGSGTGSDADKYKKKFNLDINYPPTYTIVRQMIETVEVEFDEKALTDTEILCYYAYSPLYTGDRDKRKELMASRCQPGIVAVYYAHSYKVDFGPGTTCGNDPADNITEGRENISLLDDIDKLTNRPESHYWYPGDFDQELNSYSSSSSRGFLTTDGCINQDFSALSELDSTLEHSDTGSKLNIDITATAESECQDVTDEPIWECSQAAASTAWLAHYDYKIKAATTLKLVLSLSCTGPNMSSPGYPDPNNPTLPPPLDLTVSVVRLNEQGEGVVQYRDDFSKWFVPLNLYCNDDNPVVDIQRLIEFDAPENPGDIDKAVVIITGNTGALGNAGNVYELAADSPTPIPIPPPPRKGSIGLQRNTTTMTGFVQVVPAN